MLDDPQFRCAGIDFASWQRHNLSRLAFRAAWQEYFRQVDAFLMPVLPVAAFPHDHTEKARRTLSTPEGPLPYKRAPLTYMSVANLTGCPATVAPVGRTAGGLPVGNQILGPYLEDATPIRLASLLFSCKTFMRPMRRLRTKAPCFCPLCRTLNTSVAAMLS